MTAPTTPNAELAWRVLDQINAQPGQWNQRTWAIKSDCGTAYCFAGWAVVLSGRKPVWGSEDAGWGDTCWVVDEREDDGIQWIADAAREALGVEESTALFWGANTREDLGCLVSEIFGPRPGGAA